MDVAQSLDFGTSTPARARSIRSSFSFTTQTPASAGPSTAAHAYQPRHPDAPPLHSPPEEVLRQEAEWETEDADHLAMARTFMESKEYTRVIHWLEPCRSSKAKFLRIYSQYLVGQVPL